MASKKKKSAKGKGKSTKQKKSSWKTTRRTKRADQNAGGDIVKLILEDHKPLKELIEIMKDSDKSLSVRRKAFEKFAPLLITHAKSEEEVLYTEMKDDDELREEGFEGEVEHGLADQMLEESKRTDDDDLFSARIKVLAELVEHHIEEEEDELLPEYKKQSEVEERVALGERYMNLKAQFEAQGGKDSPEEKKSGEVDEFQVL